MHSQQPPGVVQNWSTLQCSKQNNEQCGYDHAPVTRGRMRARFPLPHGPWRAQDGATWTLSDHLIPNTETAGDSVARSDFFPSLGVPSAGSTLPHPHPTTLLRSGGDTMCVCGEGGGG